MKKHFLYFIELALVLATAFIFVACKDDKPNPDKEISVTGVKLGNAEPGITLALTLQIGESIKLTVTVEPENATNKEVAWSSSNTDVAVVDATGKITAKGEGEATITVSTADGGKSANCKIIVPEPEPVVINVVGVTLNINEITLTDIGDTAQLTATIAPEDAANKLLFWYSDNLNVVTVSQEGMLKAIGMGTAMVTVVTDEFNYSDTCYVTVKGIKIEKLTITPATASISLDDAYQISVSIEPSDATVQKLIWSTDDALIATVDDAGLVKAGRKSLGTTKIWATATDGTDIKASIDVEVFMEEPEFEMVAIASAGKSFPMGYYWHPVGPSHSSELPVHQVSFTYDYKMGKHNITRKQWLWVMGTCSWSELTTKGMTGTLPELDLPATGISWNAAHEFVTKLSAKTGRKFRLPTEAEWEFAAVGRDNDGNPLSWYGGLPPKPEWNWNNPPNEIWDYTRKEFIPYLPYYVGWGSWNNDWGKGASLYSNNIQPIGTKEPNERGIYDMLGNVCEWCSDYFSFSYYGKKAKDGNPVEPNAVTDPKGPAAECKECDNPNGSEVAVEGTEKCGRVIRGGNQNNQGALKVMYRAYYPQDYDGGSQGIRVVEE